MSYIGVTEKVKRLNAAVPTESKDYQMEFELLCLFSEVFNSYIEDIQKSIISSIF